MSSPVEIFSSTPSSGGQWSIPLEEATGLTRNFSLLSIVLITLMFGVVEG